MASRVVRAFCIVSVWCSVMVWAQAPAGPNRPPQVPEDYVVTPFGYFHPSCVVHLAEGEQLLQGGGAIQKNDGTVYIVPACAYPHYTAQGEMFGQGSEIEPPEIKHSWIVSGSASTGSSYGEIVADWNVPSAPQSYDGQTLYFFPGFEQYSGGTSILQPVLGWNSDFKKAWGIASWNCCPKGTADESTPVHVSTGDLIAGIVQSTCGKGTLTCPKWNITTKDKTTGGSTGLGDTPNEDQTFNWAFGGVLEVYSIVQCSDYPPNQYINFAPTLYDNNFNIIQNPGWSLTQWAGSEDPQCGYGGYMSPNQVTLDYGYFNLTASVTGGGRVQSTDGDIYCPSQCVADYLPGTPVTLNAYAQQGWSFAGWSGACTGTGSCNLTMWQNESVTGNFTENSYPLTVTTSGSGSVTSTDGFINCPGTCSHNYLYNTQVTLNANPAVGWSFTGWSGACTGTGPCQVTMTQGTSVSASFTQAYYTLTASVVGDGTVTSTDGFINCPGMCSHTYISLTQITLNATPSSGWNFSGWTGACMGVGSCTVNLTGNLAVTGVFVQQGVSLQLTPVTPCRLVDTRQGSPIQGGTAQNFTVPGAGGCGIPSSAATYSLNVTVIPHTKLQYLTIWPAGEAQPQVSLMNSSDGRVKANAAVVPAGANDAVSVYVTDTSDVILDINGYFTTPSSQTYQFYPVTPCRVVDTRAGSNQPQGLGPPSLSAQKQRDLPILSSPCLAGITNPLAYSFNVTVVPNPSGQPLNYLTVWPSNQTQPVVSTLNNPTATVVANAAIVPAAPDGDIDVYAYNTTDLIIDIDGYFAASGQNGLSLYPVAPCRVLDTRNNGGQPWQGKKVVNVVDSPCAPPSNAQSYVFNATVVPQGSMPYLALWADGQQEPVVSTLNAYDGLITSNMAIVPTTNGSIDAYAAGLTQLILDISGYFAP